LEIGGGRRFFPREPLHPHIDKGFFGATQARRTGVTVSFADIFYLRHNTSPSPIGWCPVDPYNLSNYSLVNSDDHPNDTIDLKRSAYANLRRDFSVRDVPFTLKAASM